jgi:glycosyltransferase involved in cell wall biosynthesis
MGTTMRVGLIASPWVAVPPPQYGGTEAVIDCLARGLARAGDQVELFATGDATCPVRTSFVYPTAVGTDGMTVVAECRQAVRAYDAMADCDVIHDHTLFGPLYGAGRVEVPVVTTVHGEFTDELRDVYRGMADRVTIVAISHDQRRTAPDVPVAAVIHHGIDVDCMPLGRGEGGYAVFLGRMCPAKGADRAIRAARSAGIPLVLAAKMREPDERRYFLDKVEPLLGDDAVYVGELGRQAKIDLLRDAVALLNPIRWHEPFGLVMVEALSVGTPVIAFREGAAPEIVEHGVTGFLVEDEEQLATALGWAGDLSRLACRASVAARFSADRMVAQYRQLYDRLMSDRRADALDLGARREPRGNAAVAITG